ncbi:MAG: peptidoglycan-binding protein [Firmicutes bacterium]|nr:peptidoglycan-binding protein [Bacillota bacterium]
MATGTLIISASMAGGAIPVPNAAYAVKDKQGNVLFTGFTNESGESAVMTLTAPSMEMTLFPNPDGPLPYGVYDIFISKPGFATINIIDVEVFAGQESIQPVEMLPIEDGMDTEYTYIIPPPTAYQPTYPQLQVAPPDQRDPPADPARVVAPDFMRVHLGVPTNSAAATVRVRFIDYIKNVTCSEIYPTWPTNSIIANVHAIVSFTLNRVFTEWYPSRGYNFDITNSTTVDQAFVPNRTIFSNISQIVDDIFNVYARRAGFLNPYFTAYCNGTTTTCKGLSQWGTVTLANRGLTPLQILHNFYPNDLILDTAPVETFTGTYPGFILEQGATGDSVRRIQTQLNRIRANYPAIPAIPASEFGFYGPNTTAAVRSFQQIFRLLVDGKVGRSTWNRISQLFVAVTKMAELNGEGQRIGLDPNPPTVTIRQGSRGADVIHAQFILNYISQFFSDIPAPAMDSVFGATTADAVRAFQRRFGLTADGIVGPATWRRLYEVYRTVEGQNPPQVPQPPQLPPVTRPPFPGVLLRRGSTGASVRTLQELINNSRRVHPSVPALSVDGNFGPLTENSVRAFQRAAGLVVDGIVGPITWNALTALL